MACSKQFTLEVVEETPCADWSNLTWVVVPFGSSVASASGDSGSVVATGNLLSSSGADFDGDMTFTSDDPCDCQLSVTCVGSTGQMTVEIYQDGNPLVINGVTTENGVQVFPFTLAPGVATAIHIDLFALANGSDPTPPPIPAGHVDYNFIFEVAP